MKKDKDGKLPELPDDGTLPPCPVDDSDFRPDEDDLEGNRARAEALGFRIALPGHVYDLASGELVG